MSPLPAEKLKPSPAWSITNSDLFGPFEIRGEVNKRSRGKSYGVIFADMVSGAIYVDLSQDYSMQSFLLVLQRFISVRGYPLKVYSDEGTQLLAANKELRALVVDLDISQLKDFGAMNGLQWHFSPADAPWYNGTVESLIKSVKRALYNSIGNQVLSFSEMQTVLFEVANLVNERPIGRKPTVPNDSTYLSPNDLILGRSTSRAPSGPFEENCSHIKRFYFVQQLINSFWKKWIQNYFPSLLVQQKWHVEKRNVKVGDVVIIQDVNSIRGKWKLGGVHKAVVDNDGKVHRVKVEYKNTDSKEYIVIERSVQRLIVIVPVHDA